MKKLIIYLCLALTPIMAMATVQNEKTEKKDNKAMEMNEKEFNELFCEVDSNEIMNFLTDLLLKENNTVITAGNNTNYNSMMANWQILSNYLMQPTPTALCTIGAERRTLSMMKQEKAYTFTFFGDEDMAEAMKFGYSSGNNSDKMKTTKLSHIQTPSGNSTWKEAQIIIECNLYETTTLFPNDFYTEDGRAFIEDGVSPNKGEYHQLVLGKIKKVWKKR